MVREGTSFAKILFSYLSINILCSSLPKSFSFLENTQPRTNLFKPKISIGNFIIFTARWVLVDENAEISFWNEVLNSGKYKIFVC